LFALLPKDRAASQSVQHKDSSVSDFSPSPGSSLTDLSRGGERYGAAAGTQASTGSEVYVDPHEAAAGAGHEGKFSEALKLPTTWLCAGSYMLFNMAFWGFLSWVPNYLRDDRHIPLVKSGLVGALPYCAGLVGMTLMGHLGSSVMKDRRPALVAACCLGAGAGLLYALSADSVTNCLVGLCFCGFFMYGVFGPFWAVAIGLAPRKARGVFTGSVNCCGQIGAFSSQIIIGKLADTMKSFSGAILFMTGALVSSAVVMLALQRLFKAEESFLPDNG
jgi:sugar phosphate permease